jgi:hypothetical protein
MALQQTPRLGEILLERHWVNPEDIQRATNTQRHTHEPLGEILLKQSSINKRQLARALRWQRFVRMALLVGSCSAGLAQQVAASEAQAITDQMVDTIAKQHAPVLTEEQHTRRSTDKLIVSNLQHTLGAPTWSLLKGEYTAGVNKYTEGMRYKAKWSDDSLKLEVCYQF